MKKMVLKFTAIGLLAFSSLYAQKPVCCPEDCNYAGKYTGFDLDVGVGYSGINCDLNYTDAARGRSNQQLGVGAAGVAIQGRAGATYGFYDSWLIGVDFYGQYNSAEHKFKTTEPTHSRDGKATLNANLGLDARFGLVANPSNLFFITVGPDWVHHTFSYHATHGTTEYSHSTSEFKTGLRVGAGAEQKLSTNWVVKEQFGYSWYQTITQHHTDGASTTVKPRLATMTFSIGYLF